ncbi:MAG: hypothetical protein HYR60_11765 [Acidobacteria bacterium]|nr:hypothetical protein [Acidobacteriota bacterium]
MPRNDDGEFELVLGNRQLLSGFFIVVVLFGVFFTMGYVVGRHSVPSPAAGASAAEKAPEVAAKPAGEAPPSSLAPGQVEVVTGDKRAGDAADDKKPAAPPPEKPPAPKPTEAAKPAPQSTQAVKVESKKGGALPAVGPVASGTYLQVSAPRRAVAAGVIEGLRQKGIQGILAPGPNEDTVRVLVGPLKDSASIGKMRADLEAAGFKPFSKKY